MQRLQASCPDRVGAFGVLTICVFVLAIVAGGSSASAISAGAVRIASAPLLVAALWRLLDRGASDRAVIPALLLAAVVALLLVQRIPLPPEMWSGLPGREVAIQVYRAAGLAPPHLPISLAPHETWEALLGLAPPAAMFCAVLTLSPRARWGLALPTVLLAIVSIGLGALQIAAGQDSALRFYASTNRDSAVGFFANRNHQAALLVSAVPFAAVLARSFSRRAGAQAVFRAVAVIALALIVVVGIGVTRSRAGVLLLAPAFVGGLAIALRNRLLREDGTRDRGPVLALAAAVVAGAALVATFSLTPLAERFDAALGDDLRFVIAPRVLEAGWRFAPLGSGVGSFQTVYQTFERPEMVMHAYVNHAHNDYVETWLEAGWPGVILIGLFGLWWAGTTVRTLRSPDTLESSLALAGAMVVGLLLAHSAVDYPLRTSAMAVVFALGCGLMVPSGRGDRKR